MSSKPRLAPMRLMQMHGSEFVRTFFRPVVPGGVSSIRYAGIFRPKVRKGKLALCRQLLEASSKAKFLDDDSQELATSASSQEEFLLPEEMISFSEACEGEQPSPEQVEEAVSIFMDELGWKDHQAIYGLHSDTDNIHLHIVINRVHPETLKIVEKNRGFDIELAHKAIARIEHAQGWQREQNGRYQVLENGELGRAPYDPEKPRQPQAPPRQIFFPLVQHAVHQLLVINVQLAMES